jgi:beta-glucosidase
VHVTNSGATDGDETVELYLIPKGNAGAPLRALVGFEKLHLRKGETNATTLTVGPRQLSIVSVDGSCNVRPGDYELYVGGGQPALSSGIFLPFHIEGSSPIAP